MDQSVWLIAAGVVAILAATSRPLLDNRTSAVAELDPTHRLRCENPVPPNRSTDRG